MVRPIFAKFGGFFPKPPCTILREYARNMRINGQLKSALPPTLRGVFFPMFLAVFWAEAAVGGGMLKLHHSEVVQFQDTPYYCYHRDPRGCELLHVHRRRGPVVFHPFFV